MEKITKFLQIINELDVWQAVFIVNIIPELIPPLLVLTNNPTLAFEIIKRMAMWIFIIYPFSCMIAIVFTHAYSRKFSKRKTSVYIS